MLSEALYSFEQRVEMLQYVPADATSVLDVGCATGLFGDGLRRASTATRIVGIDVTPHPDEHPNPYDERITGAYPEAVGAERFDCIVFNDVLEHLVDPWEALEVARDLLTADGVVVASIPNVRNVPYVLRPLLVNGRWRYADTGILDRTHLRFFTRSSIVEMFEQCGYTVEELEPINPTPNGRWAALNRYLRGRLDDFLAVQFAVVARPTR
jgi:2-polyprenyl-3-methyl-5-hydroxy-6-metoxy-1,4-benzoquinol methylase